jgi:hypothetical protein
VSDLETDPFRERPGGRLRRWHSVLGVPVCFASDSAKLLRLADLAFAGNGRPSARARKAGSASTPDFSVELRLATGHARRARRRAPRSARLFSGAGMLGAWMDPDNFALICPGAARACISVSPSMLGFSYHVRYELIELAVLTLLARACRLVPLHAACVGSNGRAILLIGDSGAGKSTTCLQALAEGLTFVAEDSVFVSPVTLRAAGVPAFMHLRSGSLRYAPATIAGALRRAPRIRRRSGVQKIALDLRRTPFALADRPLAIVAVVLLSKRVADGDVLLPRTWSETRSALEATQPYARSQAGWREFCARIKSVPAFEMRRTSPVRGIQELRRLLAPRRVRS